ncbi:hypothetical protein MAR_007210, partial [Mya arenaria]
PELQVFLPGIIIVTPRETLHAAQGTCCPNTFDPKKEIMSDVWCGLKLYSTPVRAGGECAHVLGLDLKLTDWLTSGLQEEWDRPRRRKIIAEPVSSMIISRPVNEDRKKRPLTADITDNRNKIEKSSEFQHFIEDSELLDRDIGLLAALRGTPLGYLASKTYKTVANSSGEQNAGSTLEHQ